ncbi:MAG: response regulator [Bacteroidales bacterium]|jgi:two-component system phosphate regulon response regulator PhoB|nr:response regulator [Bacteroidales bacterium]MDD2687935.1 response regulator [Bacteroidales bacterium]MDD3330331.1 response regulator [Bacteroidales bacterium]MDD3691127.1 response regulator [Bacteroidales bacterium]MDD4044769.1 response regulator [Bacteroidales bacterium]
MDILKNKTVLLADDDLDMITQLTILLKGFGMNVVAVESQKEAEEFIETKKPDIAIYDLMMENLDSGFILSYKTKKKYPDVPVIIVTAVTSDTGMMFGVDTAEEKSWIKADLYLEKGLRPEQLKLEMTRLLTP